MSGTYFNKVLRRLTILLSQFGQLPHDLARQISFSSSKRFGSSETGFPLKVLVIVHAYWPEQFIEIIKYLNRIKMSLSVVVTIPDGEHAIQVQDLLGTITNHHSVLSMRVENVGRDVGPFFKCIETFPNEKWDLVIKVHTKASQNFWFETLVRSLLQSDRRIQKHAKLLRRYPDGIIIHPLFRYPGHKQRPSEPAMRRLNELLISNKFSIPRKWYFAAGSMFATKPEILLDFKRESETIGLTKFEDENEYSQASSAHANERFLGMYACTKGSGLFSTSILDFLDLKSFLVKMN